MAERNADGDVLGEDPHCVMTQVRGLEALLAARARLAPPPCVARRNRALTPPSTHI